MRHINAAVRSQGAARSRARAIRWVALVLAGVVPTAAVAQQPTQKTFASAEQASESLFAAVRSDNVPALLDLFGPAGQDIIASGDSAEDAHERAQFVRKYQEMHRLAKDSTGETVLYIGAENWPLPIPLVKADSVWHFDTEAGKSEILFRRIGRNELAAIRVCHALVDAERDYFASAHAGVTGKQYASRFVSDSGKEDGLYWKAATDQPSSPIGPLLAKAAGTNREAPFHGYYYRLLNRQGASAPGGAKSYVVNGKLTGGFAFIAWPADYQSSGVVTLIVSQADVVYQKDLGPDTGTLATAMSGFDPDSTWHEAEP
jgi:hypothetical protein